MIPWGLLLSVFLQNDMCVAFAPFVFFFGVFMSILIVGIQIELLIAN